MSFDDSTCDETRLWHHVASHLEARGIAVCLVGGAVVSVQTEGAYRSGDLDFVEHRMFDSPVEGAMRELGFERHDRHYVHPDCPHLFVEFVKGPLGIGEDTQIVPHEVELDGRRLAILSPTDCVRDRLASYNHFGARECLDQAVLVARARCPTVLTHPTVGGLAPADRPGPRPARATMCASPEDQTKEPR